MATYTMARLSGLSAFSDVLAISASSSPGTLIHTAVSGTTDYDEVWLWFGYVGSFNHCARMGVEFGGTTSTDTIIFSMTRAGTRLVLPGLILNNAQVVRGIYYPSGVSQARPDIFGYVIQVRN